MQEDSENGRPVEFPLQEFIGLCFTWMAGKGRTMTVLQAVCPCCLRHPQPSLEINLGSSEFTVGYCHVVSSLGRFS